jgi:ferredoxin-type protein NapH
MVSMADKQKPPLFVRWRMWVQAAFLLVWLDPLALRLHHICAPVFHCYSCPLATFACPIGVMANFSALHVVPFLAIGTLVLVGAVVGRMFCGWVCPFGLLQDAIGRIPTPKLKLPTWAGYGRYVALGVFVAAIPYFLGQASPLFFCRLCPAGALEGAAPNMVSQAAAGAPVVWPALLKVGITALFFVAMFFTMRPWCRLFCPLGGAYGLFNRASLTAMRFNPDACTGCGRCEKPCTYGVLPSRAGKDGACIRCLECTACGAMKLGSAFAHPEGTKPE